MPMHPFLRAIAAGLGVTFVGSIVAIAACAHPAPQQANNEFRNLQQLAVRTVQHVAPVAGDLIRLVK